MMCPFIKSTDSKKSSLWLSEESQLINNKIQTQNSRRYLIFAL